MTAGLMNNKLLYCTYGTYSGPIIFPKSSSRPRI